MNLKRYFEEKEQGLIVGRKCERTELEIFQGRGNLNGDEMEEQNLC